METIKVVINGHKERKKEVFQHQIPHRKFRFYTEVKTGKFIDNTFGILQAIYTSNLFMDDVHVMQYGVVNYWRNLKLHIGIKKKSVLSACSSYLRLLLYASHIYNNSIKTFEYGNTFQSLKLPGKIIQSSIILMHFYAN